MCDHTKLLTAEEVIQKFTKDLKQQIARLLSEADTNGKGNPCSLISNICPSELRRVNSSELDEPEDKNVVFKKL